MTQFVYSIIYSHVHLYLHKTLESSLNNFVSRCIVGGLNIWSRISQAMRLQLLRLLIMIDCDDWVRDRSTFGLYNCDVKIDSIYSLYIYSSINTLDRLLLITRKVLLHRVNIAPVNWLTDDYSIWSQKPAVINKSRRGSKLEPLIHFRYSEWKTKRNVRPAQPTHRESLPIAF